MSFVLSALRKRHATNVDRSNYLLVTEMENKLSKLVAE